MATVPAGAGVGKRAACHHAQAEGVVQFTIGQQTSIRRDDRTAKLERQSASKSSLRMQSADSPVGFSIMASHKPD